MCTLRPFPGDFNTGVDDGDAPAAATHVSAQAIIATMIARGPCRTHDPSGSPRLSKLLRPRPRSICGALYELPDEVVPRAVAVFDRHPSLDLAEHELGGERGQEHVGEIVRIGGAELPQQVTQVGPVCHVDR
jgi:hypothetical protein